MKRTQRPLLTIAVLLVIAVIVTACAKPEPTVPEFSAPETAYVRSVSGSWDNR